MTRAVIALLASTRGKSWAIRSAARALDWSVQAIRLKATAPHVVEVSSSDNLF
jgi:hypothetical protein